MQYILCFIIPISTAASSRSLLKTRVFFLFSHPKTETAETSRQYLILSEIAARQLRKHTDTNTVKHLPLLLSLMYCPCQTSVKQCETVLSNSERGECWVGGREGLENEKLNDRE